MSIFDTIKNAIFGSPAKAEEAAKPVAPSSDNAAPSSGGPAAPSSSEASAGMTEAAPAPQTGSEGDVDVAAVLDAAVAKSGQKLDWRKSIVDLMKALGLDSSLSNRQELAKELGYNGDASDSATMNVWLHKQVIQKLKANGGKVPADLA